MSGSGGDAPKRTDVQGGLTSARPKRMRAEYRTFDIGDAWDSFDAEEQVGDHDDHSAQCRVEIFLDSDEFDVPSGPIEGLTGRGHGHAEMDALHELLEKVGDEVMKGILEEGAVSLDCVAKPCCVHCSTMLGMLNVRARTPATMKSRHTMLAGGAWSVSLRLKTFLMSKWRLREDDINALGAMGQARFDRAL